MANRFLNNIKINDAYTFPASDGTNGQFIATDGAGNLSFQSAGEAGATVIYKDLFTGDNSTVEFTLANSVDNEIKTQVYFDGVYQSKENYTLSGNAITFSTAPPSGAAIEVITFATVAAADYNQKLNFYGKAVGAITKGDAVMFAGAQGDHFLIAKATQAALEDNHEYFLGLAAHDFANNQYGYVTQFGRLESMDTSDYTAGDILWFDSEGTVAGAITTTEPAAPNTRIQIAAVVRVHQEEGVIFIRPTVHHELGETTDVSITSVADKDLLAWNAAGGVWENTKTLGDITTGDITTSGTVDGVDVSSFKSAYDSHNHDDRYYTELEVNGLLSNSANWDTAYSWGNHSLEGYLTSFTETDPIYVASSWYNTTNNSSNWDTAYGWGNHATVGYLTSFTETDPIFSASPSASITSTQISNWDTAFGWGNHASAGYLTSFTETDPIYTASSWYTTTNNSTNWNTAYGWGNHASAGYLTSLPSHNHDGSYLPIGARYTGDASDITVSSYRLWDVSTATDDPSGATDGLLLTGYWDSSSWATQQYHDFHSNTLFIRNKYSGTWQGWKTIIDSSNIGSQSVNYATSAGTATDSSKLPLTGGELSGVLYIGTTGSGVYLAEWKDGGGVYLEGIGNSADTRKIRIQSFNGSNAYAQWFMDGGNMQIYGDVAGNRNFLIDSTTSYIRHNGSDKFWGGADGTRNAGWAYHNNNDTGIHWPNNGWHLMPFNNSDFRIYSGNGTNVALRLETAGTTRGYVYAENDNSIGFLSNSRGWVFRSYSNGNALVYGSINTTALYDSNNTNYYIDPNGGSVINSIQVSRDGSYAGYNDADLVVGHGGSDRRGYGQTGGSNIMLRSSSKSTITALDENQNLGQLSYENLNWTIGEDIGWGVQQVNFPGQVNFSSTLKLPDNSLISVNNEPDVWGARFRTTTSTTNLGSALKNIIWTGGGANEGFAVKGSGIASSFEVRNDGIAWASSSFRAPVFYDSNDTNYKVDPDGTSNLWNSRFERISVGQDIDGSYRIITSGDIYLNSNGNGWAEGVWKQRRGGGTFYDVIDSGNIGSQIVSQADRLRAYSAGATPQSANTFSLGILSNYYGGGQITDIPEGSYGSLYNFGGYDNITLSMQMFLGVNHNSTSSTRSLYFRMANNLGFQNDWRRVLDSSSDTQTASGIIQSNSSLRAPIFYDSDNTAHYVDPSGGSNIRNLYVGDTGSSWSDPGGWGTQLHVSNGPHSIIRVYARSEGIETGMYSHVGGQSKVGSLTNHDFSLIRNYAIGLTLYNGYVQAEGSSRAPIFYDSNDTGYYLDPNGTSNIKNLAVNSNSDYYAENYFYSNKGPYSGAVDSPGLQVYSQSNNSAFMSFHKGGYYAVNMGLDTDNVFRIGGWSAAANRMQLDMSGNVTFAGDVTAYSDARVKENVVDIDNALDKVSNLRGVYYNRTDSDDKSKKIGVIAQEIQKVLPEVVSEDQDGMLGVSYGNITAILIEAIKELSNKVEELENKLNGIN